MSEQNKPFHKYPHWLTAFLCQARLSSREINCLMVIVRKTLGFNKEWDSIAVSQFQKLAGIKHKGHVYKYIKSLEDKKIIEIDRNSRINRYRILEQGTRMGTLVHKRVGTQTCTPKGTQMGTQRVHKWVNTKETITKENSKERTTTDFFIRERTKQGEQGVGVNEGAKLNEGAGGQGGVKAAPKKVVRNMSVEKFVNLYFKNILGQDSKVSYKKRKRYFKSRSVERFVNYFSEDDVYNIVLKAKDDGYNSNIDAFLSGGYKNYVNVETQNNFGMRGELIKEQVVGNLKKMWFRYTDEKGEDRVAKTSIFIN